MKTLIILLFIAAAQFATLAQFVVTPSTVTYVTNGAFTTARCTYFLPADRTYIGEQVDAYGRRIRTVGLATIATGGGTVTHSIQVQSSIVQPVASLTLYRIVDATGASAGRIADLRDIPFSIYLPSPTLGPSGVPNYKTSLAKGVLTLTAERRFGEWFFLEEWRAGTWLPARWVPIGGKASFVLAQRFVGTNPAPAWRVSTLRPGVQTAASAPPLPPGFTAGTPQGPAPETLAVWSPSASHVVAVETNIVDSYHDRSNGLFFAWAQQPPGHDIVFEDAAEVSGPWTERAFWPCSGSSLLIVATVSGVMERRYVRARLLHCNAPPALAATDAAYGENVLIPSARGPQAVIRLHASRMRLSPGWALYTAAHPK